MAEKTIPKLQRICQVKGCGRMFYAKGWCVRHYRQMIKYGKVYGNPTKLKQGETNRCVSENDVCKIELYDKEGNVRDYTVIDAEDYNKIKDLKWSLDGRGYVTHCRENGISSKFHRVIIGALDNETADHIDGDPLNNRKVNLRMCTHHQNTWNNRTPKNNTSGYKGVHWNKEKRKWGAGIKYNYKKLFLGYFDDKIEAAKAYNTAAIKHFGDFARLNDV